MIGQKINSENDLNKLLNTKQQKEILKDHGVQPIESSRPKFINQIVFLFPALALLGSFLFSTYLITTKDYSDWVYLSGLMGIILSL